ncbi:hypothetical protein Lal_00007368 [Lupinus albus]|nr:hypothetical protein Lal_00007368 [Lupinus albus]
MSIKWTVELGISDIIKNQTQPITLPHLISALQVPQSKATSVQRIMRLLAHNHLFVITKTIDVNNEPTEAYGLTPTSELLVKGTDHSLSSMVEFITNPTLVEWTFSEELTLTEVALGSGVYWKFLQQNPGHLKRYNEAMESDSHLIR